MSFAILRDNTETILKSVTDIGKVHPFRRSTLFWEDFFTRHTDRGRVRNWEISRIALASELEGELPLFRDRHLMTITGWMSLDDSVPTEPIFQGLIESIRTKFREGDNKFLGRTAGEQNSIINIDLQVVTIDFITFGGQAVHFCEIQFEAEERDFTT